MLVLTSAGHSTETPMALDFSSARQPSLMPTTAYFVAL